MEENNYKVSVIIPVYNGGEAFSKCLEGLLRQSLREIEIICVDDGSDREETRQILETYQNRDGRIRVIRQENQGAGVARNTGLLHASGEYLSFLDADDFYEDDMLEKAYLACSRAKAEIGIFRGDRYDEQTGKTLSMNYSLRREMLPEENPFTYREVKENVFTFVVGWAWDKLYLREFVLREGLRFQDTRTSNDLLFTFSSLVKANSILAIDELLIHHRVNQKDSLSVTREKSWNCFYIAGKALYEELVRMGVYPEVQRAYLSWMLHFSFWNLDTIVGLSWAKVYDLLKTEVFPFLDLTAYDRTYFREPALYDRAMEILEMDIQTYLISELVRGRERKKAAEQLRQENKKLKQALKQKEEGLAVKAYRRLKKLVKS